MADVEAGDRVVPVPEDPIVRIHPEYLTVDATQEVDDSLDDVICGIFRVGCQRADIDLATDIVGVAEYPVRPGSDDVERIGSGVVSDEQRVVGFPQADTRRLVRVPGGDARGDDGTETIRLPEIGPCEEPGFVDLRVDHDQFIHPRVPDDSGRICRRGAPLRRVYRLHQSRRLDCRQRTDQAFAYQGVVVRCRHCRLLEGDFYHLSRGSRVTRISHKEVVAGGRVGDVAARGEGHCRGLSQVHRRNVIYSNRAGTIMRFETIPGR